MPLLTSISPTVARAGEILTVNGSGFEAGLRVSFAGVTTVILNATLIDDSVATIAIPDVFPVNAGIAMVSIASAAGAFGPPLALALVRDPAAEPVWPLVSLPTMKTFLRLEPNAVDDARLAMLIQVASGQIAAYCGRRLASAEQTEKYDGDGSATLRLRTTPVTLLSALVVDGQAIASPASAVKIYEDRLVWEDLGRYSPRIGGFTRVWPTGRQNITVTYTGGYLRPPSGLHSAAIAQVLYLHNTADALGMVATGNNQTGAQNTYSQADLCPAARRLCVPFRRVVMEAI